MSTIRSYKICVSDEAVHLLKTKLRLTRFPAELEDVGWNIGVPLNEVRKLVDYWRQEYDWRKHELALNRFAQYTTKIDVEGFGDVGMHFIHEKSVVKGAIPLLFVHGWPGSFIEATKIVPLLTSDTGGPKFHVVAPSLPNFGFSSRIRKDGFGIKQHAEALHKVMLALDYPEYVCHGGDWGYIITRALGHMYPESVKAIETNWVNAPVPNIFRTPLLFTTSMLKFAGAVPYLRTLLSFFPSLTYSEQEMTNFERAKDWFYGSGRGYYAILGTKPQTISYSMADSPSGLLAFIWEKLHDWADDYSWTPDEILTWISIYWFSEAGPGASGMIYNQAVKDMAPDGSLPYTTLQSPVVMPLGFSCFPKEISNMPKAWTAALGNVVFIGEHADKGGHFAAYERPDAIVDDLKTMFGKGGGAFGVVKGCDGY